MCLWNIKEKIKKYIYNESVIKSYFGIKLNIKKINIAQFIAIIIFIIWVTFGFTINMLPVKLEFVPLDTYLFRWESHYLNSNHLARISS